MIQKIEESFKVIVRTKPLSKKEIQFECFNCLSINKQDGKIEISNPENPNDQPKSFSFNTIIEPDYTQEDTYTQTAYSIVDSALQGYNGTIITYGQTGSGKQFTQLGEINDSQVQGIIPRAFQHIFNIINSNPAPGVKYLIGIGMFEIYNEQLHDLFDTKKKLAIKEKNGDTYVHNLSQFLAKDVQELKEYLIMGLQNRKVGQTNMGQSSSRSNLIVQLTIETCTEQDDQKQIVQTKLNFVSLSGTEKIKKTGIQGNMLQEVSKHYQGLSSLGNVISSLTNEKSTHIPYRDSKITRILQNSLGGYTKTAFIATVSPASFNYVETLSTLRFAWRAKNVINKPKPVSNIDPKDSMFAMLTNEIDNLKQQLENTQLYQTKQIQQKNDSYEQESQQNQKDNEF